MEREKREMESGSDSDGAAVPLLPPLLLVLLLLVVGRGSSIGGR